MKSSCFLSKEKTWTQTVSIYQLVLTGVITSPANLALLMAFGWHTQKEHKDCKDHKAGRRDTIKLFSPKYVSLYHDRTMQTETLLQTSKTERGLSPRVRARLKGCCFHRAISLPSAGTNINPKGHFAEDTQICLPEGVNENSKLEAEVKECIC